MTACSPVRVAVLGSPCAADADYVCDGAADEVEIHQAIAAQASSGGGVVVLMGGTYITDRPIVISSDRVKLIGKGAVVRLSPTWGQSVSPHDPSLDVVAGVAIIASRRNAVRGVEIDAQTNSKTANGIVVMPGDKLGTMRPRDWRVKNNIVKLHTAHAYGVWSWSADDGKIKSNTVEGLNTSLSLSDAHNEGIECIDCDNVAVTDNTIRYLAGNGMNIGGGGNGSLRNSIIRGNRIHHCIKGIHIGIIKWQGGAAVGIDNVKIDRNEVTMCKSHGILMTNPVSSSVNPQTGQTQLQEAIASPPPLKRLVISRNTIGVSGVANGGDSTKYAVRFLNQAANATDGPRAINAKGIRITENTIYGHVGVAGIPNCSIVQNDILPDPDGDNSAVMLWSYGVCVDGNSIEACKGQAFGFGGMADFTCRDNKIQEWALVSTAEKAIGADSGCRDFSITGNRVLRTGGFSDPFIAIDPACTRFEAYDNAFVGTGHSGPAVQYGGSGVVNAYH